MLAASASHDYSKMYGGSGSSLSKQPSSTSTAPIDSSAALVPQASSSFKHVDTNKSFNYSVPGGVGGTQAPAAAPGYYMQVMVATSMYVWIIIPYNWKIWHGIKFGSLAV